MSENFFTTPETIAEQKARLERERRELERRAMCNRIAERITARVKATALDTTGDLFDRNQAEVPLFAPPAPKTR